MSRIQVGEITIDGQSVHIGSPADPPRIPGAAAAQPSPDAFLLHAVPRIPVPTAALALAGVLLVVAGTAVSLAVGVLANPLGALLRGGVLAPVGLGLLGLALLKRLAAGRSATVLAASLPGDPETYVARLRPLLAGDPASTTVAALARRAGWTEPVVVRVLALMRQRGEVAEELDLDTGHFYYTTLTLPPRDLDSRLGELHP